MIWFARSMVTRIEKRLKGQHNTFVDFAEFSRFL